MSAKRDGGPAFPVPNPSTSIYGMSLRDYFAAKAMLGMVSHADINNPPTHMETAVCSYQQADAMLEARQ